MDPPTKSWASGRVLSEAQRARKREQDKKASRERRNATQRRIAQLEETISLLLESGPTANLCVLRLADQMKGKNEIRSKTQSKDADVAGSDGGKTTSSFLLTKSI
jgi:hypothetical protein